jgi:hypothetical protein
LLPRMEPSECPRWTPDPPMKTCQKHAPDEITRRAIEHILHRTGGRVRNVVVAQCSDRMVVRGTAETYHGWQLAIAACQEVLAGRRDVRLDCQFEIVRPFHDRHDPGRRHALI